MGGLTADTEAEAERPPCPQERPPREQLGSPVLFLFFKAKQIVSRCGSGLFSSSCACRGQGRLCKLINCVQLLAGLHKRTCK